MTKRERVVRAVVMNASSNLGIITRFVGHVVKSFTRAVGSSSNES